MKKDLKNTDLAIAWTLLHVGVLWIALQGPLMWVLLPALALSVTYTLIQGRRKARPVYRGFIELAAHLSRFAKR